MEQAIRIFGYDLGRHASAVALMPISPEIIAVFLPNLENREPLVLSGEMTAELAKQANELLHASATRWVIRG